MGVKFAGMMGEGRREADFRESTRFVVAILDVVVLSNAKSLGVWSIKVLRDVRTVLLRVQACVLLIGG